MYTLPIALASIEEKLISWRWRRSGLFKEIWPYL
jgi:hypothetical protein